MNNTFYAPNDYRLYLEHHGIKGMRWGIRRFQNPDGSLTSAGRSRYGRKPGQYEQEAQRASTKAANKAYRTYKTLEKQIHENRHNTAEAYRQNGLKSATKTYLQGKGQQLQTRSKLFKDRMASWKAMSAVPKAAQADKGKELYKRGITTKKLARISGAISVGGAATSALLRVTGHERAANIAKDTAKYAGVVFGLLEKHANTQLNAYYEEAARREAMR